MKTVLNPVLLSLLAFLLVIFAASSIFLWHTAYSWHDQQRMAQLLLIFFSALFFWGLPQAALPRASLFLLGGIFCLGLISVLLSAWPQWGLLEWAHYAGLVLLALLFGGIGRGPRVQGFVIGGMVFVGFLQAFQFLLFYLMAFVTGVRDLDAMILVGGFDNRRFFGQFQVMLLPVLAFVIVWCWQCQNAWLTRLLFFVLAIQWCISFFLGGRGLWLGLLASHLAVLFLNRRFFPLLILQTAAAVLGAAIFALLFKFIPNWLELFVYHDDAFRSGLSEREQLWQSAWDMALSNPWLGVGPMHFSAVHNFIAAHPHQVILQWLAEWGFFSTAMALMVGLRGMVGAGVYLRSSSAEGVDVGLAMAILGALVLAQVDGVFVMPYTETWLAVLIGLALARCLPPLRREPLQRWVVMSLALAVVLVFMPVLVRQLPFSPFYDDTYLQKSKSAVQPRFWQDGSIPWRNN